MRVDVGQTGFFERRMWRLSYEFTALADTPQVFKVVVPVNFILHHQDLVCDQGGIVMRAYRPAQGVEGGSFGTPITFYSNNAMTEQSEYAFQAVLSTGGTFTPNVGAVATETIRARSAGATAQQATVGSESYGERGLPAGTYYLVFSRMTGVTGDCKGVYTLHIEERP